MKPEDIEVVIYAAVCRENFEPASACYVAAGLGVSPHASVFDISNACLGVLNGIIDIANRVELGQIRAGLVVSCETSREIIDTMIQKMMTERDMETFKSSLATLTGGSGAVAVLVTDGSFSKEYRRKLIGGTTQAAPQHHGLCKWGLAPAAFDFAATAPAAAMGHMLNLARQVMSTDSVAVLKHGVDLGLRNWRNFLHKFGWASDLIDKVVVEVGIREDPTPLSRIVMAAITPRKQWHIGDPYDRLILAAAVANQARLATKDGPLRAAFPDITTWDE